MAPKKGRGRPKKASKDQGTPDLKPEDLEYPEDENKNEEVKDEQVDTNPDLDVEMDPQFTENDETLDLVDTGVVSNLENIDRDVEMENVKVDLDMDDSELQDNVIPVTDYYETDENLSSEDLFKFLGELIDSLLELSSQLDQEEEEEEEGAIKEDEVPFERLPDDTEPSDSLVLHNLPPEFDSKKVVEVFNKFPKLVSSLVFTSKTKSKVVFTSKRVATEAKNKLDNLKLYNRRIQALFTRDSTYSNYNPNLNLSTMSTTTSITPNLGNHYPNYNKTFLGYNIPPPPSSSYTGTDRNKITFNKYKLSVKFHQVLLQSYNESNLDPGSDKLVWDETRSFYKNQLEFDKLQSKLGLTSRYVMVGNLSDHLLDDFNNVQDFVSRYTNNSYTHHVVKLPLNYPEEGGESGDVEMVDESQTVKDEKNWLYIVFDKNRDGSNFYNKLNNLINYTKQNFNSEGVGDGEDNLKNLKVKYCCPLASLDSLWIGNVSDLCGYFNNEDELYAFFNALGTVKNFKLVYESNCIFVTFQNKYLSTKVYNFLNGLSPHEFIKAHGGVSGELPEGDKEDYLSVDFSHGRGDNSFVLGQKLLNAIKRRADSQELIDRFLSTNDISCLFPRDNSLDSQNLQNSYRRNRNFRRDDYRRRSSRYDRRNPMEGRDSRDPRDKRDPREMRDHNRFRQKYPISKDTRVDRFGRTIRPFDKIKREEPWKQLNTNFPPPPSYPSESDKVVEEPPEPEVPMGKELEYCKLLKRGKYICKVSCVFIRGDSSHRLPELLDVNQRANPERLKNYLSKTEELSLWQLGADSKEDSEKYDSLCDYLISKNRVALVQQGPYEIYIVPPQQQYIQLLNAPDAQFMYAYLLSKSS